MRSCNKIIVIDAPASSIFYGTRGYQADSMEREGWTYAKAGVDIERKSRAISSLVDHLRFRRQGKGRVIDIKGQFTALIDFEGWVLTLCTDGVGTKLLIAEELDKWDTVGIDCMAMNVNDTICVGAEPIAFVDYIAIDRPDERITSEIGVGLELAAEMANVDIVGGEIAVLPEIVKGVDLSGSALGFLTKDRMITGKEVRIGDAIVGLRSSGVHSNGLTLARRVLEGAEVGLDQRFDRLGGGIGLELLRPTTIYVRDVVRMLEVIKPTGMVDVTGGGLKNFVRLKKDVEFCIDDPIAPQPIFQLIQELGNVTDLEMYKTFNMGMGMGVVLRQDDVGEALRLLGDQAKVVGQVTEGTGCGIPELSVQYDSY
jgi:phosphoribosylformylglycinamidine cyclo-ligase